MAELMAGQDFCVGAAGSSAWERCCLGLPMAMINVADNQTMILAGLEKANATIVVERDNIAAFVNTLLTENSIARLTLLSLNAREICDGLGVKSVSEFLTLETVTIRPAMLSDLELVFSWQSSPNIRKYFRNKKVPTLSEHSNWYVQSINNPLREMYIIQKDSIPVGTLRLDLVQGNEYEISILVNPAAGGQGIAGYSLEIIKKIWPQRTYTAVVDSENIKSLALFQKAGFDCEVDRYIWKSLNNHE